MFPVRRSFPFWDLYLTIGENDANAATRDVAADAVLDMYLRDVVIRKELREAKGPG